AARHVRLAAERDAARAAIATLDVALRHIDEARHRELPRYFAAAGFAAADFFAAFAARLFSRISVMRSNESTSAIDAQSAPTASHPGGCTPRRLPSNATKMRALSLPKPGSASTRASSSSPFAASVQMACVRPS